MKTLERTREEFEKALEKHYPNYDHTSLIGTGGGELIFVSSEGAEVLTGIITNRNTSKKTPVIMIIDDRGDFELYEKVDN